MNIKSIFKSLLPHLLIVLGFIALSYIYFSPVIGGKDLPQMDNTHAAGMAQELINFEKQHPGELSLWTNSMFGGMPSYLIKTGPTFNIFHEIQIFMRLHLPYTTVSILFILLFGFYFLLQVLKFDKWLSVAGAFGFAFASFNIIIISVGHITQVYAIAYMPTVLAGVLLVLLERKYFLGGIVTMLGGGLEISCSHPQISYYTFMIVFILFICYSVYAIKEKEIKHFLISSAIVGAGLIMAIIPNMSSLLITYEYSKYSNRGPSEISKPQEEKKSAGLDKNYAYDWSYGIGETFSIMVPNLMAAGVNGFKEDSKTTEELQTLGLQSPEKVAASLPIYWGGRPFTSGPNYFGAIICFLFVLGLFLIKGPVKWWLLSASIISIVLAWGKNFTMVSDLFFYYFPSYSKFRTVEMTMVIANFTFPLLGFFALKEIVEKKLDIKELKKGLKYSGIIVGGLLLLFILIPGLFFDFTGLNDGSLIENLKNNKWPEETINNLLAAMRSDRESVLRADAFRSLIFIAFAFGVIWVYVSKGFKTLYLSLAIAFLILVDMWAVDRRYLNNDNFVSKNEYENQFVKTQADEIILQDPDPNYRVLNLTKSPFTDAYTPYFHKSIGGYHGAKLRRYQDLIDGPLSKDLMRLQQLFGSQKIDSISNGLKSLSALNMLNTKYIIFNPNAAPLTNTAAMGNAWFVNDIKWVNNPDEEYKEVRNFDPAETTVIDKKWATALGNVEKVDKDTTASIKLTSYKPNQLLYSAKCSKPQIVVFSEIFYEKGWNAFVDGKLTPHGRANYVLRALQLQPGEHKIEFKFEPKTYENGKKLALISSIVVGLLILFAAFKLIKDARHNKDDQHW